jgi:hypothetical protein
MTRAGRPDFRAMCRTWSSRCAQIEALAVFMTRAVPAIA